MRIQVAHVYSVNAIKLESISNVFFVDDLIESKALCNFGQRPISAIWLYSGIGWMITEVKWLNDQSHNFSGLKYKFVIEKF